MIHVNNISQSKGADRDEVYNKKNTVMHWLYNIIKSHHYIPQFLFFFSPQSSSPMLTLFTIFITRIAYATLKCEHNVCNKYRVIGYLTSS